MSPTNVAPPPLIEIVFIGSFTGAVSLTAYVFLNELELRALAADNFGGDLIVELVMMLPFLSSLGFILSFIVLPLFKPAVLYFFGLNSLAVANKFFVVYLR